MDDEVEERVYTFDELSDRAKERARDNFRQSHLNWDWWEHTYDDATTVGKSLGLYISQREKGRTHTGKSVFGPDIWFQYSCSQGDGCCWSGELSVSETEGAIARVASEYGADEELAALAKVAEQLYAEVASLAAVNRLSPDDEPPEYPEVEVRMYLGVEGRERSYTTHVKDDQIPSDLAKTANCLVDGFADWIFDQLEAEYGYQMADEQIDEAIINAELSFDEDGNEQ